VELFLFSWVALVILVFFIYYTNVEPPYHQSAINLKESKIPNVNIHIYSFSFFLFHIRSAQALEYFAYNVVSARSVKTAVTTRGPGSEYIIRIWHNSNCICVYIIHNKTLEATKIWFGTLMWHVEGWYIHFKFKK